MFIGHCAVAFAAKKVAPRTSLGTLFIGAQLIDLLWPLLLLLGVEHVRIDPGNTAFTPLDFYDYPVSHSLLGALGWSAAIGLAYYAVKRYRPGAWALGAAAFAHWLFDLLAHGPDLPLAPGSDAKFGLGLWNSVAGTIAVEGALFAGGLALYLGATREKDRVGRFALWGLVALLLLIYVGNALGPPPPTSTAIAAAGMGTWLLVAWAYWADRHRTAAPIPAAPAPPRSLPAAP